MTQPAPFNLTDMMAEAAWAQADRALAQALRDAAMVEQAVRPLKRGAPRAKVQPVEDGLLILSQSLSRAARARGLKMFGAVGAVVPFDPRLHEAPARAREPKLVRITTPGVTRASDVVMKAVVTPSRARVR